MGINWILLGFVAWFILRYIVTSFYVVNQNERAVKTSFGRAQRRGRATTLDSPLAATLRPDEHQRYRWPLLRVLGPGFHFKWPWERVYKVSIATASSMWPRIWKSPRRTRTARSSKR